MVEAGHGRLVWEIRTTNHPDPRYLPLEIDNDDLVEWVASELLKLNAPRNEGGMGFRHTHYMARRLAKTALRALTERAFWNSTAS